MKTIVSIIILALFLSSFLGSIIFLVLWIIKRNDALKKKRPRRRFFVSLGILIGTITFSFFIQVFYFRPPQSRPVILNRSELVCCSSGAVSPQGFENPNYVFIKRGDCRIPPRELGGYASVVEDNLCSE